MSEVITTAIIGFISTIVGYIAGNRRSRAEVNALEIEYVKEVIFSLDKKIPHKISNIGLYDGNKRLEDRN